MGEMCTISRENNSDINRLVVDGRDVAIRSPLHVELPAYQTTFFLSSANIGT